MGKFKTYVLGIFFFSMSKVIVSLYSSYACLEKKCHCMVIRILLGLTYIITQWSIVDKSITPIAISSWPSLCLLGQSCATVVALSLPLWMLSVLSQLLQTHLSGVVCLYRCFSRLLQI